MITLDEPCLPQNWLRTKGNTLDGLSKAFGINVNRHKHFPNLVQLKYGKVGCDFDNPLVRQCRGLILDEDLDWMIVARPFDKFGNVGESYAAQIDWRTATIQEKLDGSLMILYYYRENWHVATSGRPDASGEVNGYGLTFGELFWDTWRALEYGLPNPFQRRFTFMFELTTPLNKVVVKHNRSAIRLIGVRDSQSGQEHKIMDQLLWEKVKEFAPVKSLDLLQKTFEGLDPTQQEGYVVLDAAFRRIKVKHPGYVILHRMRDNLSPRGILNLVLNSEWQQLTKAFPEWEITFEKVQARLDSLAMLIDQEWEQIKGVEVRKEFALRALKSPMPPILFMLLDKKITSAAEGFREMHIDRMMDVIGMRTLVADAPVLVEG
jgi:hypothetical protein